ncbi:hypothetical protein N7461_006579 [Penicillium sp. DV-2018c]|nr:hypothetical protein N7461_006579 [Penicillium sp. DV-2018c]
MPRILNCLLVLLASLGAVIKADTQTTTQWPLQDNGLNTVVQWDHYSFQINNQRIFIFSGEFHYWRIPVPGLWRDILEKIKAAGFTAFAFYSSWAYHAPNNETVDFKTGAHDITPIFELAKELGLYIIVRPGPYVNAEANAGLDALFRGDDADYESIENEYGNQWIGDATLRKPNDTAIAYRSLWSKYHETKLLALFTRSARDLTMTELMGNGTQYTDSPAVRAYELRNPETNAAFYATFHSNTSLATDEPFHLKVNTSVGGLTIPRHASSIRLNGHQSKIIVTDFRLGSETLLYSTAEVLTYAVFDEKPTLVLWVPTGESVEFSIKGAKRGSIKKCQGCSRVTFSKEHGGLTTSFTQHGGITVLDFDDNVRVIVLDRTAAYEFWAPALTNDPFVPEDKSVLVQGPYLVRSAKLSGSKLAITGDVINATTLEVFAPEIVNSVTWNGKKVHTHTTDYGSLKGSLSAPRPIKLPALTAWKSKDSLPERFWSYDDSGAAWVDANHMTTLNPRTPTTLPVLYADEYGFHNGVRLWRGYFNGTATGAFINVQGGSAFGWSAWLNGNFIASHLGDPSISQSNLTLSFENISLSTTSPNVLLILHDDTGHDETVGALNPRGILDAVLHNSSAGFTHWRLAGTAGGNSNLDPVRGVYNEDGLYAERVGWHLPGFNDEDWHQEIVGQASHGSSVLSVTGTTVRFFRCTVPLDLPRGTDISISFILSTPSGSTKHYRAQLFVNGYQYGRYNPHVGNQVVYPVPVGILDYGGVNTVGVAVWAQSEEGASLGVEWRVNYVAESSLDVRGLETGALRPGWEEGRLRFG